MTSSNLNHQDLPVVSIMIATYNSGWILSKTLDAIRKQSYPKKKLDILIVDGGSTDNTRELALKYGCRVLDNPKKEPGYAKLIGFREARGKYLITIDHDEILVNKDSIANKVQALLSVPECRVALCSGYTRAAGSSLFNEYMSEFGDPYSLYIYYFPKGYGFFEKLLRRHYSIVLDTNEHFVVDFKGMKKQPLIEVACLGTMIDREFFVENTDIMTNISTLAHIFYMMLDMDSTRVIVLKGDPLIHDSLDSLKKYWPKLKWRICNNVHFPEKGEVGFSGRAKYYKGFKYKRYFFIPYAFTLVFPLIQGLWLSILRRNPIFILHPVFSIYVAAQILYHYTLKCLGITPAFLSYDGKSKAER